MVVTEYDVGPGAYGVAVATDGVVWTSLVERGELAGVGPDRTLWYTLLAADRVGRITLDGGAEEFPLPDPSCRPHAIAVTVDGGCWATLWAASSIVRLDRDGRLVDEISFQPGAEPHGLAIASDGTLWVALEAGSLAHLTGRPGTAVPMFARLLPR